MSPRSYYSDEEDLDIHVTHRGHSPAPVRYVQSPPRPRTYYGVPAGPSYLVPEQQTTLIARSRSRDRSRERRESPPQAAAANPVIINNRFYNDHSSDDDDRSRSRSRSRPSRRAREDWQMEQTRRDLDQLRLTRARETDEHRLAKEYRDEAELQSAKRELDDIKRREARADDEKRIKREMELQRLREEEQAIEEKKRRDKEAAEAVERYKQKEMERRVKEEKEKEENEKEYQRRLQEDLIKSGLDEKAIAAIISKKKVPEALESTPDGRPTYTRMRRKYLSIETLRTFQVEYDLDTDPEFILIKRWVPEWEQDRFWKHTKVIREKRTKTLMIEEKHSRHREPDFEWVRKKSDHKRSKSPSVLTYLAGGRPH